MKYDYDTYELAKKVRGQAAATIHNESIVIQNDEQKVEEALNIIKLCNTIIKVQEASRTGSASDDQSYTPR